MKLDYMCHQYCNDDLSYRGGGHSHLIRDHPVQDFCLEAYVHVDFV